MINTKIKSIAIIGAGITGLTAAFRLSQKGFDVTIYEKSSEIGGLAAGFQMHGNNIEKTYHHLFRSDKEIINLFSELNISEKLIWHKSSISIYFNNKIYPFGTPKTLLTFSPLNIIDRIRTGAVMFYLMKTKNWKSLVHVPAFSWMKKFAGKNSYRVIWEPLLKGKFDKYYNKISMAWLWGRIHIRANSQEKGGERLGYPDGGFKVLISTLKEKLKSQNVTIKLNTTVENIFSTEKNVSIKSDTDGEKIFDKVLVTSPSYIFANMIDNDTNKKLASSDELEKYISQLKSVEYLGAVVAIFSSSQDLGEYYWNNINDLSMPFLAFINHTKLIDKSNYDNKFIYYIGTYLPQDHEYFSMLDEKIYDIWFESLKKIFPDFDSSLIIKKNMFKFKNAQHIVDTEYEKKLMPHKTILPNVYLANFAQIFPEDRGTNYAVRDGENVADNILSSMDV